MKPFISGNFSVESIKREKISEIFWNEDGDKWFKAKVFFITLDEEKGVEKETGTVMYVQANDINDAENQLQLGIKGTMADYRIGKIEELRKDIKDDVGDLRSDLSKQFQMLMERQFK